MRVLVIGGAGYIGSHVVRALLDKKYDVVVYDNLSTGCRENLFDEAVFVEGDICNERLLDETMAQGFDALVHLAASKAAGESMVVPEKYAMNNICGTIHILNAASRNKVRYFIFSSTASVYGEPRYLPIDEKHPTNPENFYGFTKLEIERLLAWYDRIHHIRYVALRYFNAAGYDCKGRIRGLERNPQNLLPIIMEVAAGIRPKLLIYGDDYDTCDGTGLRDYIHVTDLADAHVKSLEYLLRHNQSLTVNLGSEQGITVKEMVENARKITGQSIPVEITHRRSGDTATVVASSGYAQKTIGWQAHHSHVDMLINSTWKMYKNVKTVS